MAGDPQKDACSCYAQLKQVNTDAKEILTLDPSGN